MTSLADFILLGHEKVGSFALSSDKTDLFATALRAWLQEVTTVMNQHAIPRLFAFNASKFGRLEKLPQLSFGDIETPNLKDLGQYIKDLSASGAELFPDDELENKLRGYADLPSKPEDDSE